MPQLGAAPPQPEKPSPGVFFLLGVLGIALVAAVIYLVISYLQ